MTDREGRRFTDHGLQLTHELDSEGGGDSWHRRNRPAEDLEERVVCSLLVGLSISYHNLRSQVHTLIVARR
jgi:hypothetical protein